MNLNDLANSLGSAMAQSREYISFKEKERALNGDEKSQDMVKEFNYLKQLLENEKDPIKITEYRKKITDLYQSLENNKRFTEFNKALNDFLDLRDNIKNILDSYINIDIKLEKSHKKCGCNKCHKDI